MIKTIKESKNKETPAKRSRPGGGPPWRGRSSRKRKQVSRESRSDLAQKVIKIRRVTRVVAGGRRFSFSVVVVVGDKNGSVGVGIGKGSDTAIAIEKAIKSAKKNMIKIKKTDTNSLPHEVRAKYNSADVLIIPVPGKGLVAGSAVRNVLDHAGITDITAKILSRSKNKLNIARATVKALAEIS